MHPLKCFAPWRLGAFLFVFCTLLGACSPRQPSSETLQQLESLAQESARAKPAWEEYKKSLDSRIGTTSTPQPLKTKEAALKLMTLARAMLEKSGAAKEFLKKVTESIDGKKNSDRVAKIASKAYISNIIAIFDTYRVLFLSAKPLHFYDPGTLGACPTLLSSTDPRIGRRGDVDRSRDLSKSFYVPH
ncbi:hypothetical protein WDW37_13970 [Bdellovibrionota bacterium FG-1]